MKNWMDKIMLKLGYIPEGTRFKTHLVVVDHKISKRDLEFFPPIYKTSFVRERLNEGLIKTISENIKYSEYTDRNGNLVLCAKLYISTI